MPPSPRDLARLQALGRVAAGVGLTFAPRVVTSGWVGSRDAGRTGTQVLASAMGARDLALGLGQVRAVGNGFGAPPWIAAGILADTTDLVATWRARDELSPVGVAGIAVLAGGSALLGLWLARSVD